MHLRMAVLILGIFCVGTAELSPSGMLGELSRDLSVTIPTAGLLVTVYALTVVVGGPTITIDRHSAVIAHIHPVRERQVWFSPATPRTQFTGRKVPAGLHQRRAVPAGLVRQHPADLRQRRVHEGQVQALLPTATCRPHPRRVQRLHHSYPSVIASASRSMTSSAKRSATSPTRMHLAPGRRRFN
jgi:hypothetical protein